MATCDQTMMAFLAEPGMTRAWIKTSISELVEANKKMNVELCDIIKDGMNRLEVELKTEFAVQLAQQTSELKTEFAGKLDEKTNELKTEFTVQLAQQTNELKTEFAGQLAQQTNELKTEFADQLARQTNELKADIGQLSRKMDHLIVDYTAMSANLSRLVDRTAMTKKKEKK